MNFSRRCLSGFMVGLFLLLAAGAVFLQPGFPMAIRFTGGAIVVLLASFLCVALWRMVLDPLQTSMDIVAAMNMASGSATLKTPKACDLSTGLRALSTRQDLLHASLERLLQGEAMADDVSGGDEADPLMQQLIALSGQMSVFLAAVRETSTARMDGDIEAFLNPDLFAGLYHQAAEALNESMFSETEALLGIMDIFSEYAAGDFSRQMNPLPGKKQAISDSVNHFRAQLIAFRDALSAMYQAQKAGDMEAYIAADQFQGQFAELAVSVNESVILHLENIFKLMDVLGSYAHGDFNVEFAPLPGKQAMINEQIDKIRDNLLAFVNAVEQLTDSAKGGQLDHRVEAHEFKGSYNKIARNLNDMLDAVVGPLNESALVLQAASNNDLAQTVQGDYQGQLAALKENVNATMANLNIALGQVVEAVGQVNSGAEQISDAAQSLSQGATEQASSLEEITSSMAEIASQTKTNAENANQANSLADSVRKAAEKGSSQMTQMMDSMESINASSAQIAKIIKVIDDIAFQTNLLALNAAVEAARAGRHGKGFAVVADEVRNLAGRSAKAAKETAELIESSGVKTKTGMQVASATAESFKEIVTGIVKTNDLVGEIAAASSEQAQGVSQINIGLSQVDQVTQQNTANAEETAAAAEELSSQATYLQGLVAKFRLSDLADEEVLEERNEARSLPPAAAEEQSWGGAEEAIV